MKVDEKGYIVEPEELNQEYESAQFLILTHQILSDNRLSDFQKLLFSAITGLCREKGYCWASNAYFEKFFNKGHSQVEAGIKKLDDLGYIRREIVYKKKQDKDGNTIVTKQVAYRKIFIVLDFQNQEGGILKNQEEIYNNITNNIANNNNITKVILSSLDEPESSSLNEINNLDNINNKENECVVDFLVEEDTKTFSNSGAEPAEEKKSVKRKGGLAPLIDEIENFFKKDMYPEINILLNNYLHCYIGCRKLPSLDKWQNMLKDLINYSSISLPGVSGKKLNTQVAIQIVEKAIAGKDGAPFTEFDDIYHYGSNNNVMEPHFNLNQTFTEGY